MAAQAAVRKKPEALEAVAIDVARDTLGDLVIRAGVARERIVITRHGKQTAALVSIADLERLQKLDGAA